MKHSDLLQEMTADDVKTFDFVFLILPVKYNVVDD